MPSIEDQVKGLTLGGMPEARARAQVLRQREAEAQFLSIFGAFIAIGFCLWVYHPMSQSIIDAILPWIGPAIIAFVFVYGIAIVAVLVILRRLGKLRK
jgi:ABC-type antimicrobial peptide transport system permease subunit